jgi:hypothetical protein
MPDEPTTEETCPQCDQAGLSCLHSDDVKRLYVLALRIYSRSKINRKECMKAANAVMPWQD